MSPTSMHFLKMYRAQFSNNYNWIAPILGGMTLASIFYPNSANEENNKKISSKRSLKLPFSNFSFPHTLCASRTYLKKDVSATAPLWRSNGNQPFNKKYDETTIFSGNSNQPLAKSIANCLGTSLGKVHVSRFADGEVNLQYPESLRGKDVYIIQPTSTPVNEHLVELLLMISTARRSSAKKITAVIPYYGYARQDRKLNSRVPISAADVARMIESAGADRVISVDLHCGQIQGFFGPRVPVDNLEAQIIAIDHFVHKNLHKPVVISPDAGGVYRARKFQQSLMRAGIQDVGLAMIVKQRLKANEIERMDLVGNVDGCDVVIVDDMIDTAGTLCEAAKQLKERGAKRVFAFATHALFSHPALQKIENSQIEEIVVCDTIKPRPEILNYPRIHYLNIAPLIADAIRRIHQKESLQQLFVSEPLRYIVIHIMVVGNENAINFCLQHSALEVIFQSQQKTMFSVGKAPKQTLWLSDTAVTLACPQSQFLKILAVNPSPELSNKQLDHLQNYVFRSCNDKPFCKLQLNDSTIQANISTPLLQRHSINVTSFCRVQHLRDQTLSKRKSLFIRGHDNLLFPNKPLSPYSQLEKMSKTFLILPCLRASCHSLEQITNLSSNEAKKSCSQNPQCSFILNETFIHSCSDTSVSVSARDKGSRLLIKGSKVLQNLKQPLLYYIYLNHQAICADDQIISEHTGIASVKESIDLCDVTPLCEYFTMTVESGLSSEQHPCGPLPNHVWLCKGVQQKDLPTLHDAPLTSVSLYGTISGYKKHFVEIYGEPLTLAMTNEF